MKFKIDANILKDGVDAVFAAAAKRSTLPVLGNILFQAAESGKLRLCAMNMEFSLSTILPAKVESAGEITLPAELIRDLVASFSTAELTVSLAPGHKVTILTGKRKTTVKGIDAGEFPIVKPFALQVKDWKEPGFKAQTVYETNLPADVFAAMVKRTEYAVAKDYTRPILDGLFMGRREDREFLMVGLDGFRLSAAWTTLHRNDESPIDKWGAVVPAEGVRKFAGLMGREDYNDLAIAFCPERNQVCFKCGSFELTSQVIEGNYPDWARLVPALDAPGFSATFKMSDATSAAKLARLFAPESGMVTIEITGDDDHAEFALTAVNQEEGDVLTIFDATTFAGDFPAPFGVSGNFLRDAIKGLPLEDLRIQRPTGKSPIVLREAGGEGEASAIESLALIMPMSGK